MATKCAYGQVTRNMVENLREEFKDLGDDVKFGFLELKKENQRLFNHMSSRLPQWATTLLTIGGSVLSALAVWIITH